MLTLSFFGSPQYLLDGRPISGFASRKAEALLIYLACSERAHARESLATLLWDDRSHEQALANLSVLLSSLRKQLSDFLAITRHDVGIQSSANLTVDVRQFEEQLQQAEANRQKQGKWTPEAIARLRAAVSCYTGDLLSGFSVREASGFEEWLFVERERLQRLAIYSLETLGRWALEAQHEQEGIGFIQRLLAMDKLHEAGYRLMIELLANSGQRSAALQCYQQCKQVLQEELGVPPSAATTSLYELVKSESRPLLPKDQLVNHALAPTVNRQSPSSQLDSASVAHNLPAQSTRFCGRQAELSELESLLGDQNYRLISLIGPGGVGKTRLSLEVAQRAQATQPSRFAHGVWQVELEQAQGGEQILTAIAAALNFQFNDGQRRQEELLDYLRNKNMLLVLDNFEHLLDAAVIVAKILAAAAGVVVLVTSRQRLNLLVENVIDLDGLETPSAQSQLDASIQRYAAIQLFLDRAQRLDASFRLAASQASYVVRICQMVNGLPLAIELAAAWVRTLTCREIADEIAHSFDFLATHAGDSAQRHSSLRAVFEHSWQLIGNDEQMALAKLSVFRAGFTREAALQVAGASLHTLAALIDKSLVRRSSGLRYTLHPVLAQYSAEKLKNLAPLSQVTHTQHANYFARFLHQRQTDLENERQLEVLCELDVERENLTAAYTWALANEAIEVLDWALEGLLAYLDVRCLGAEGMALAERTQQLMSQLTVPGNNHAERLLGRALVHHALFCAFEHQNDRALALIEQALPILCCYKNEADRAFAHNVAGLATMQAGDLATAQIHFAEALAIRRALGKEALVASTLINSAQIAWRQGDLAKAQQICQAALQHAESSGDRWRIAQTLNVLGILAKDLARPAEARKLLRKSGEVYQQVGNRWGIAAITSELGSIAFQQGSYSEARAAFELSLAIRRDLGNVINAADDILWLGKVAEAQEQLAEAERYYQESLALVQQLQKPDRIAQAREQLEQLRVKQALEQD